MHEGTQGKKSSDDQEVTLSGHDSATLPAARIGAPDPVGSGFIKAWRIQVNTSIAHHQRRLAEAAEARDRASERAIDAQIGLQRSIERLRNVEQYVEEDRADFRSGQEAARMRREEERLVAETRRLDAHIALLKKQRELERLQSGQGTDDRFEKFSDIVDRVSTLSDLDEFMRREIAKVEQSHLSPEDKAEKSETIRTLCHNRAEEIEQGSGGR